MFENEGRTTTMQSLEELKKDNLFEQIASSSLTEPLSSGDDRLASIRGFQAVFKQVSRTPSVIRMLLQNEFHFEGQVDASNKAKVNEKELLSQAWFKSTFVIPNFSNMVNWSQRFALESEKGNTVVAIIPARTNTNWFHDYVISKAAEIRFIKGRLTFPGYKSQSPFPDLVAVYIPKDQRRKVRSSVLPPPRTVDVTHRKRRSKLSIITSFTSPDDIDVIHSEEEPEPKESQEEEEEEEQEEDN
jgi:hypothetical protein